MEATDKKAVRTKLVDKRPGRHVVFDYAQLGPDLANDVQVIVESVRARPGTASSTPARISS